MWNKIKRVASDPMNIIALALILALITFVITFAGGFLFTKLILETFF